MAQRLAAVLGESEIETTCTEQRTDLVSMCEGVGDAGKPGDVILGLWSIKSLGSPNFVRQCRVASESGKLLPLAMHDFDWKSLPNDLWSYCNYIVYGDPYRETFNWFLLETLISQKMLDEGGWKYNEEKMCSILEKTDSEGGGIIKLLHKGMIDSYWGSYIQNCKSTSGRKKFFRAEIKMEKSICEDIRRYKKRKFFEPDIERARELGKGIDIVRNRNKTRNITYRRRSHNNVPQAYVKSRAGQSQRFKVAHTAVGVACGGKYFNHPAAAYAAAPDHYDDYRVQDDLCPDDDLDVDFRDDEPETVEAPVPERRSRHKLMVAGVLVAAVATGGGAAFVYKSYQYDSPANLEAPTLVADSGPITGEPSDPGGKEFPDGNKQIYDRLSGEPAKPVAEQAASDSGESASFPGIVTTGADAPADMLDERIAQALRRSGSPSGQTDVASADPDSPRTVRTLTIRPDGSVAPAAAPEPPKPDEAQTVTTAGIIATSGPETDTAESTKPASEPEDNTDTAAASAPSPERAAPRPKGTRVASAEPASTASTQPQTASANPYFVQLAARRDQTSALAAFADLQQKYPSILNGLAPTIKKADLGDKGVWYRLWVGPMNTRGNAEDVCGKLKSAGLGGCFVRTE